MTTDAKIITRTNAEALIPVETSNEIIKEVKDYKCGMG